MITLILASLLILPPQTTSGAVISAAIKENVAFRIAFEYPTSGLPADFRWWCDGAILKNFNGAEIAAGRAAAALPPVLLDAVEQSDWFEYAVSVPGLARGSHACVVSAVGADQVEHKSALIPIEVGTTPIPVKVVAPRNVRVIVGGGA